MKTVLVVEDEKVLQDVYKIILDANGYNVVLANNGFEGLTQLKKHIPDIVLLDLFMPVMDGKEFMRNVELRQYPNTRVIINTNHSDSAVEEEMMSLGAHKFMLKSSMTPQDLVQLVESLVKKDE